jgi:hypothetical protein
LGAIPQREARPPPFTFPKIAHPNQIWWKSTSAQFCLRHGQRITAGLWELVLRSYPGLGMCGMLAAPRINSPRNNSDENSGVGSLGRLRLSADTLEVIAFGTQKFRFARKMIEKYLGACITFRGETENDLKEELRSRLQDKKGQRIEPPMNSMMERENEIPPEVQAEILSKFHEQQYRQFMDSPVPMLENETPRQAAKNKMLRPKLIDLMKLHIHGIEKRNQENPYLSLNIDWVLDELELEELKRSLRKQ